MKNQLLLSLIIILMSIHGFSAYGQGATELARLSGSTNEGMEFYLTFHPCRYAYGDLSKVMIFVASTDSANVTLEIPSLKIKKTLLVLPNDFKHFELQLQEAMMYVIEGQYIKPLSAQTWAGRAIHITSDKPVVCFGNLQGDYDNEGFLAIPVKNWGDSYVVSNYTDPTDNLKAYLPSFTSIIGSEDDTKVEFTLGGNDSGAIPLPGNNELAAGQKLSWIINKGDILLLPGKNKNNDLSGSKIKSDKPIGVISGNYCVSVPNGSPYSNYTIEMDQPVYAWGEEYCAPFIANELKNPIKRIYFLDPNAYLYFFHECQGPFYLDKGFKGQGWIERASGNPAVESYSSDKPINIVLYSTGEYDDYIPAKPFQMNLISTAQFQNDISFVIPNLSTNFPYNKTFLSLFLKSGTWYDKMNKIPDDYMIGWSDSTGFSWHHLNEIVTYIFQFTQRDSTKGLWGLVTMKLPGYSFYRIKADSSFGVYCYGGNNNNVNQFGYPAASLFILNDTTKIKDTIPPYCDYTFDSSAKIFTGIIYDVSQYPKLIAGLAGFYFDHTGNYNFKLFPDPNWDPIKDTSEISLRVIDPYKDAYAEIHASDKNGNDTIFAFTYKAPRTHAVMDLTDYNLGSTKIDTKLVSNSIYIKDTSMAMKTYAIDGIVLKMNNQNFNILPGDALGKELSPNDSIPFTVEFSSSALGNFSDSIGIKSNGIIKYYAKIRAGISTTEIKCDSIIDFGEIDTNGTKSTKYITVNNIGLSDLLLTGMTAPADPAFTVDEQSMSEQNPIVISPNGSKQIQVNFYPYVVKSYLDSVSLNCDAIGRKTIILKGKGAVNNVFEKLIPDAIQILTSGEGISFKTSWQIFVKSIQIYDYRGIKVLDYNVDNLLNNMKLNTKNLSSGLYLIRINTDINSIVKSIIIVD